MQIDIPAHIEKQLFLRDSVTIPGLGGFTATRTAATADYSGGVVNPPSKTLTFSENLTTDDGVLTQDIAQTHGISTEEARKVVTEFSEKTQQLLQQREIVTLAGIGRLYKNYVQKIQFLPDAANFNAESYGLPPLQFSPITRSREVTEPVSPSVPNTPPPPATVIKTPPPPPPVNSMPESMPVVAADYEPVPSRSGGWATALGVILLLAAIGMGIWYWQHQKMNRLAKGDKTEVDDKNTEKTSSRDAAQIGDSDSNSSKNDESSEVKKSADQRMKAARETVQNGANGRECVLVIATLQDKINADRLVQKLKNENYQVYFLEKNGYQVGVQFRYNDIKEVQEHMIMLRDLTGANDIWIKKK